MASQQHLTRKIKRLQGDIAALRAAGMVAYGERVDLIRLVYQRTKMMKGKR